TPDPSAAARRISSSRRSLHLYGLRTRCGARLLAALVEKSLQFCSDSRYYFLFSRAAGCCGKSDRGRAAEAEVLRSGHGPRNFARPRRKLPNFSGTNPDEL